MSRRSDSQVSAYDPFGEAIEAAAPHPVFAGDRRIRNAAIVVFWTLALLLTAGRVYFGEHAAPHSVVGTAAPLAAHQQVASTR